jgi:hypothetical protein
MMLWAVVLLLTLCLAGEEPAATQPQSPVKQWLLDLASDDAEVREAARKEMLGMSRVQPLAEIVRHVYLATEPYPEAPGEERSFIGLSGWRPFDNGNYTGIIFERRLPGFDAYRALEDGDVILRVEELPDLRMDSPGPLEAIRKQFPPGAVVHLVVLRDDRVVRTTLRLSVTPLWHMTRNLEDLSQRETTAEQYWNREFLPLLENGAS